MKISYIQNNDCRSTETRITYNLIDEFKKNGIDVLVNECTSDCDFIICLNGLSQYVLFEQIRTQYPHIKTIMYVWDLYTWTKYATGYDNIQYYTEIWTPSYEVILRLNELYNINPNKCKVIKCYAELFEDVDNICTNGGYVYHFARDYVDKHLGWTSQACTELGIPLVRTTHGLSFDEYKKTVLQCSFLVLEYEEASTGGLTMIEGYYHGKNVLFSDSIYQGGRDYFGDRAYYFSNYDDFKTKIKMLYEASSNSIELSDRKHFCMQYTKSEMINRILKQLNKLL